VPLCYIRRRLIIKIHSKNTYGFTLVELSIVLVIIGLIVGGVVGGQSLIQAAKINAVVSDFQKYKTAVNAFDLQYDALPGDFTEASDYWTECVDVAGTPPAPCNGNGDRKITPYREEGFRAWQHLSLAKILPNPFTGISSSTLWVNIGVNVPEGPFDKTAYIIDYEEVYGKSKNYLRLAGVSSANDVAAAVFTPANSKAIDNKIDDGSPTTGKIFGEIGLGDTYVACVTGDNYNLSNTEISCRLFYQIAN
jgi:prepilin-type N-terminal cleavage/methylation domain-containing protein